MYQQIIHQQNLTLAMVGIVGVSYNHFILKRGSLFFIDSSFSHSESVLSSLLSSSGWILVMSNIYGVGLGRGTVRRYMSDPGFPSYRASSVFSVGRTPPPPGTSPNHRVTPDGVLTQVQRRRETSPGVDSNSTDALFNDGFDFDDVQIPESGLSQSFPQCKLGESEGQKKGSEDLLSKVISLSNLTHCSTEGLSFPSRVGEIIITPLPLPPEDSDVGATFKSSDGYREGHMNMSESSSSSSSASSYRTGSQGGSQTGEKRSSSDFEATDGSKQKKVGRDERDAQSFSDDPDFEDSSNSTHLSAARIQKMLKSLTPVDRNNNSDHEERMESSVPAVVPVSTTPFNKDVSWGTQVPIQYQAQHGYQVLVPVANGPDRDVEDGRSGASEFSLEISSAVKQVRHALVKMVDGVVVGTGLEKHDFPLIHRSRVHVTDGDLDLDLEHDSKKIFRLTIPELILPLRDQINVTFECNRVAKFLLVARNRYTKRWSIPSKQRFHDVLNQVDSRIRSDRVPCQFVFRWNSEWEGGIGLMGLCITDTRALELYRTVVSEMFVGDLTYNTYPKDVLSHGTEVSLLLRAELKCLDLKFLPYSLFEKNRLLAGSSAVRYSKDLGKDDQNSGKSAPGKLVVLETDSDFRQSIQNYPSNHHFKLGTSTVKLRYEIEERVRQQQQQQRQVSRDGQTGDQQQQQQQQRQSQVQVQGQVEVQQRRQQGGMREEADLHSMVSGSASSSMSSAGSSSSSFGWNQPSAINGNTRARWAPGHSLPVPVPAKHRDIDTKRLVGSSVLSPSSSMSSSFSSSS